jgi:hypothetical protein
VKNRHELNKGVIARSVATCLHAEVPACGRQTLRHAGVAISRDCFTEFTLSKITRFFASLRMTRCEGFAMTPLDGNLFMTFNII